MGNIQDRWTIPNPDGGYGRIPGPRYGRGARWQAEWLSPDGHRHRKAFEVKDAAKAHIEDQESNKRNGTYVSPNRVTVGDMWPRWQMMKSRLARTTREGYNGAWKLYVGPRWEGVALRDVDKASVMEWLPTLTTKAGTALSASWARQVGIVLRGILDMAVDGRLIPSNPLTRIGKAMPKQLPSDRRYLSVAEVDELLVTAEAESIGLPVRVLTFTGVRRGEMSGLQVRDLDVGRRRLRVARDVDSYGALDQTKTRRHRDVPIGESLLRDLQAAARGRDRLDFLLPAPSGGAWTRDAWRGRWERATGAAGLGRLDTHELRHTAVSLAINAGANVKTVQRMVGHASAAITLDVYGHLWDDELDTLPAAIERHMQAERDKLQVEEIARFSR